MKIIELFAGIGTQYQGFKENIKTEVVGISEIDQRALKIYEKLHGKVNNFGDISKIEKLPYADI
jgi:DNA (cytosine-5)-methyltransferase 1